MIRMRSRNKRINAVAFSPDGRRLVAAGAGLTISVWDLAHPAARPRTVPHDTPGGFHSVHLLPDGRVFAARQGGVVLSSPDNTSSAVAFPGWQNGWCPCAVSADFTRVYVGGWELACWDLTGDRHRLWFVPGWGQGGFTAVAAAPDGNTVAVYGPAAAPELSADGPAPAPGAVGLHLREASSGRAARLLATRDRVDRLAYSPDGARLAGICGRSLVVWDVADGRELTRPRAGAEPRHFNGFAFYPNGAFLAAGEKSGSVHLFETDTGRLVRSHDWGVGRVYAVTFSPDGTTGGVGGHTGVVVWDVDL